MAKPYFISKWTTSFYYINYIPDKADVSSTVEINCNLKMNLPLTTSTTTSVVLNMTTMKMEENGPSNEGIDTGNWLL
jgi:hypothetical protein